MSLRSRRLNKIPGSGWLLGEFPSETRNIRASSFPSETRDIRASSFPSEIRDIRASGFPSETRNIRTSSFPSETRNIKASGFPSESTINRPLYDRSISAYTTNILSNQPTSSSPSSSYSPFRNRTIGSSSSSPIGYLSGPTDQSSGYLSGPIGQSFGYFSGPTGQSSGAFGGLGSAFSRLAGKYM